MWSRYLRRANQYQLKPQLLFSCHEVWAIEIKFKKTKQFLSFHWYCATNSSYVSIFLYCKSRFGKHVAQLQLSKKQTRTGIWRTLPLWQICHEYTYTSRRKRSRRIKQWPELTIGVCLVLSGLAEAMLGIQLPDEEFCMFNVTLGSFYLRCEEGRLAWG